MLRFFKTMATAGIPFGLAMAAVCYFQWRVPLALILGLASGPLFGVILAAIRALQGAQLDREDPCLPGELLIMQGAANHFRGLEGVGGWLWLTNRRLLFRSHGVNVQTGEMSIPLETIVGTGVFASLGIIPNGLRIDTGRETERFVVVGREGWIEAIKDAREQLG